MDGSNPEHYPITDFLKWADDKELVLNPAFQRGPVWQAPAKSYLIDSILRGYPIPKLLIRTVIDREKRRTIRDVVDGQQRLRTIIDFANNKFILTAKAAEFGGMRYRDLTPELQDHFLAYKLSTEQLVNASDQDVLEVFVRINSYAVPVNEPELRNARYDSVFAAAVKSLVLRVRPLWEIGVVSDRDRVRMRDQSAIAELYGFLIEGLGEGDERSITRLYEKVDKLPAEQLPPVESFVDLVLEAAELLEPLRGERLVQRPHFVMLFAALAYWRSLLPIADSHPDLFETVERQVGGPLDFERTRDNLTNLNYYISSGVDEEDEESDDFRAFTEASSSSTQRWRSRLTRFPYYVNALVASE